MALLARRAGTGKKSWPFFRARVDNFFRSTAGLVFRGRVAGSPFPGGCPTLRPAAESLSCKPRQAPADLPGAIALPPEGAPGLTGEPGSLPSFPLFFSSEQDDNHVSTRLSSLFESLPFRPKQAAPARRGPFDKKSELKF